MLQNLAWQEDLRKNVETEILDRLTVLDRPLKEFAGVVERASGELKTKLDNYNKERERDHRQGIEQVLGFLSSLWQESEMDSSDIKIRALEENNNDLTQELRNNKRFLQESQDQIERLKREKNEWQELYLKTLPAKRSSEDPVPPGDKRCRTEGGNGTENRSSSVETRTVVRREGSRWDVRSDPPRSDMSNRRISEIVIGRHVKQKDQRDSDWYVEGAMQEEQAVYPGQT